MSAEFRQLVDRILRCREAEDEAKDATKDVYAEAKANGYDKTVLGKLVAEIRAQAKNPDKVSEQDAILETYRSAYHGSHTQSGERAYSKAAE